MSAGGTAHSRQTSRLRLVRTADLSDDELATIRSLMDRAFGTDEDEAFTDADWQHSLGGTHAVLDVGGTIVAHASIVERALEIAGRPLRTGYVEAVATEPAWQGLGHGTVVMTAVTAHIRDHFEFGTLGTGAHHFYERLGWRIWRGSSAVRTPDGVRPTPDDDGYLMVLRTDTTPALDDAAMITCDWRPGDVW